MEIFGRLAIACLTTGICLLVMDKYPYYVDNLSSIVFPSIVIFILSYIIGSLFMMVFEVGVDTIFLCFLVDEKVHGQPKFASPKLLDMTALHYSHDQQGNVQQGQGYHGLAGQKASIGTKI